MTRLRLVACLRIRAVSIISTMKVLCPWARLSEAPTRENSLSTSPRRARVAGTMEPVCASRQMMATCRSTVDLPAMLGPVSRHRRRRASSVILLGTKLAAPIMASTTGWRPSSMKMSALPSSSGRHQPLRRPTSARLCQ